jgi:hypothetical protein
MKKPEHHRKRPRELHPSISEIDLNSLAERVTYEGSPKHKRSPKYFSNPEFRSSGSICPPVITHDLPKIMEWLRIGIQKGAISSLRGEYPQNIWYLDGEILFEAVLTNKENGQYHGFPLEPFEWPEGIKEIYHG